MASVTNVSSNGSADELAKIIREASSEWLMLAPAGPIDSALSDEEQAAWDRTDAVVVVNNLDPDPLLTSVRRELPPSLATLLVAPWMNDRIAIRVSAARSSGDIDAALRSTRDIPHWGLLLHLAEHAATQGQAFDWQMATEPSRPDSTIERPLLAPDPPADSRRWLVSTVQRLCRNATPGTATGKGIEAINVTALTAGFLQCHDFLEESHQCSQSIEHEGTHRNGDYWHAIMHRREPDYGNSKYWFHHVGRHPIFPELAERAIEVLSASTAPAAAEWKSRLTSGRDWNAEAFVDLCSACASDESSDLALAARRIQWIEMLLLLRQSARDAGIR